MLSLSQKCNYAVVFYFLLTKLKIGRGFKFNYCRISYFGYACPKKEIGNFVSTSPLTGKRATQKIKNVCSSSLWTCLHHMVILRIKNKITDFFDDFSLIVSL